MAYLEFRNLIKVYDDSKKSKFYAVKNSNIQVEKGELVVFVGPSGCGKSTSLRMLAGLEDPTSGEIIIDGQVVNDMAPKNRDIAMVFQDYALYPHMKVKENLSFGLENMKIDKKEVAERVEMASNMLELSELLDRLPKQLSGGQRQRVALGRALVREPKVFLLDEPLSNLDAKLRVQTRKQIAELHKKLNATMVYVTHDQIEAMTLGDKIVVMNKGEIQQIADPQTLYNYPVNTFVAEFIGTPPMNLISAVLIDENTVDIDGLKITIAKEILSKCENYIGKRIILGIRPEHITVNNNQNTVCSVKANMIEFLGSENLLYFNIGTQEIIAKVNEQNKLSEDRVYDIGFKLEKMSLFDSETEERI
ncbi:ABC transporter ATP-binding protein [Clostridium sp. DJ247]|uniref:ABC transporter ATP-binding protein n=1 Tax=Clostridium sp. DJ247 TaxID=2726188 RepID=UPI00162802BA|nr:sn-glycerol-3-phosphate ABC transporter ATP-binding protein UgpC [Clostridium sp. DJ247]MBC2582300.1 sn-glycerol-3-phosphate ABC transporter ATP-binding protein UgpC [Clostridium sp. DJ247]